MGFQPFIQCNRTDVVIFLNKLKLNWCVLTVSSARFQLGRTSCLKHDGILGDILWKTSFNMVEQIASKFYAYKQMNYKYDFENMNEFS